MSSPSGAQVEVSAKRARFTPSNVPSLISSLRNLQARDKKLISSHTHIYTNGGAFVQPEDVTAFGQTSAEGFKPDSVNVSANLSTGSQDEAAGADVSTLQAAPCDPSGVGSDASYHPDKTKSYITSWKMSEHHYRRADCPFPTLARGLFTANEDYSYTDPTVPRKMDQQGETIVGRGYDKFFNVGEVDWTKWEALQRHTAPPYHLTYKSNGCLILISALSPTELMVASKHSLGTSVVPGPKLLDDKAEQKEKNLAIARAVPGTGEYLKERSPVEAEVEKLSLAEAIAPSSIIQERTAEPGTSEAGAEKSKKQQKREEKKKAAEQAKAEKEQAKMASESKTADSAQGERHSGPNHAAMGRKWLKTHLERAGKREEELAAVLWEQKLSCILEVSRSMSFFAGLYQQLTPLENQLCDDEFEEHVLATPKHLTGLHLHGLNRNTPHFATLPPDEVSDFAKAWGFIPTASVTLESLRQVRDYADTVAKEGRWQGDPIEGFVVRSTVADMMEGQSKTKAAPIAVQGEPPYPPGSPFFFKIKFDEPYLMYRQWREITKTLMPLRNPKCAGRKNRNTEPWTKMGSSMRRPESRVYAEWVAREMMTRPEFFDGYQTGIVRVREEFLSWTRGEGKLDWDAARETSESSKRRLERKFLIAPIAIPGMGKTILGLALSKLIPEMAHVQSDNIKAKSTKAGFLKDVKSALKERSIVFADRNNHLPQHHEEISELPDSPDLSGFDITKIALVFDVDRHPYNKVLRIASERVLKRGENHQSLRPDMADRMRHETIVKRFQSEFVPPEGGLFDEEIRLSVVEDPLTNLKTAVNALWPILGKSEIPDHEHLQRALKDASEYRIEIVKKLDGVPSNPVRYYALSVELDLEQVVRNTLLDTTSAQEEKETRSEGKYFLERLVDTGRIISKPHVTIVHQKNVEAEAAARVDQQLSDPLETNTAVGPEQTMWKACLALDKLETPTLFDFTATGLIWNDRVMTLVVGDLRPHHGANEQASDEDEEARSAYDAAAKVEEALCRTLTNVLHVTVGTADETIPPFEARSLVEAWRRGEQQMTPGGNVRYLELRRLNTLGRVVGMN